MSSKRLRSGLAMNWRPKATASTTPEAMASFADPGETACAIRLQKIDGSEPRVGACQSRWRWRVEFFVLTASSDGHKQFALHELAET